MTDLLRKLWTALREVSGDDAYERYLTHWRERHAAPGSAPLDRAAFFAEQQLRKWNGVSRCC